MLGTVLRLMGLGAGIKMAEGYLDKVATKAELDQFSRKLQQGDNGRPLADFDLTPAQRQHPVVQLAMRRAGPCKICGQPAIFLLESEAKELFQGNRAAMTQAAVARGVRNTGLQTCPVCGNPSK